MRRRDRSDDWVTVWSTEEEKNEHGICFWGLQWPLAGYRRGPSSLSLIESGVRWRGGDGGDALCSVQVRGAA